MNPTEHDTHLLKLLNAAARAEHTLAGVKNVIVSATDLRPRSESRQYGRPVVDPRTFAQALADFRAAQADRKLFASGYQGYGTYGYPEKYEAAMQALAEAAEAVRQHEANYTGWQRFWLVTSSPGHVHSSRNCSSCKWTTTYALVPDLSASTEAAAVEMFGPAMCSVCFPTAPTGAKIAKALAESVGTEAFAKNLAKHQAKNGIQS